MCGICGLYNYKENKPVDRSLIHKMNDMLKHRGPDDEGDYFDKSGRLAFGHRRLSIIDLGAGRQPMCNEDGNVWITYNGEIYNFPRLKSELTEKGHRFRTASDTEVLIHLYEEDGESMFDKLNGIFAFVIWDAARNKLLAARDHFGVKPFYYYDNGKAFIFASELKAILLDKQVPRRINPEALDLCLTFRYSPSPYTLIQGVNKLEPGSYLVIENGQVHKERYFRVIPEVNRRISLNDWIDRLSVSYQGAIKRQMISDVPVGISLSGGIDSGTILSIMGKHSNGAVNAFTVGFELGEAINEIDAAKELADLFSARFDSKIIKQNDYLDFFNRYIWYLDEPIGNESALAYYFVAELAKGKVKVLLNGQGADEPFAGYPRHLAEKYSYLFRFLGIFSKFSSHAESITRMLYSLPGPDMEKRFFRIYSIITDEVKNGLYNPGMKKVADSGVCGEFIHHWVKNASLRGSGLEKMLYIDARTSLPDNLLLCGDKMSMACGIEARVPFLDIEVMKISESIPGDLKINGLIQKYVHKLTCERFLPKKFIYKKKIGFSNPVNIWLSNNLGIALSGLILKNDSLSRQYLNVGKISWLIEQHRQGKADHKRLLFLLLSLEKWYRIFILNEAVA